MHGPHQPIDLYSKDKGGLYLRFLLWAGMGTTVCHIVLRFLLFIWLGRSLKRFSNVIPGHACDVNGYRNLTRPLSYSRASRNIY
jgi:hypothetical protein